MRLRPYQQQAKADLYSEWQRGARNVCLTLPTGAGKTVLFSDVQRERPGPSCAIAHRQELVSQISNALAAHEVKHRIIGPKSVVKLIVQNHTRRFGRSFYDPGALAGVAGVDTLNSRRNRDAALRAWCASCTTVVQDECHHVLRGNKWGNAHEMFPNALGLLVTATPYRADGKGLGAHADGIADALVLGPSMRELINAGYLCDYRVFSPETDIDLTQVGIGATGDYKQPGLRAAVRRSTIVGDIVEHYLRIAPGKRGVTFATDVAIAGDIAARFNAAGVPAAVISAETPDAERQALQSRFAAGQLLQLVNVDLLGEGYDVPGIEVVSMGRPTHSRALYVQQFGRALRLLLPDELQAVWDTYSDEQRLAHIAASSKPRGIIIDHVGNVVRHGLPDAPQNLTLDRRERRRSSGPSDVIPVKACAGCASVFERVLKACPYCGHITPPVERSGPEFVDGDLTELDAETLARMRGEVQHVDRAPAAYEAELVRRGAPAIGARANRRRLERQQQAQAELRDSLQWWAGWQRALGRSDSESYRRFYFRYGTDVLSAMALGEAEARSLAAQVNADMPEGVRV